MIVRTGYHTVQYVPTPKPTKFYYWPFTTAQKDREAFLGTHYRTQPIHWWEWLFVGVLLIPFGLVAAGLVLLHVPAFFYLLLHPKRTLRWPLWAIRGQGDECNGGGSRADFDCAHCRGEQETV